MGLTSLNHAVKGIRSTLGGWFYAPLAATRFNTFDLVQEKLRSPPCLFIENDLPVSPGFSKPLP